MNNILAFLAAHWVFITASAIPAAHVIATTIANMFPSSTAAKIIDEVYKYVMDAVNMLQPLVVRNSTPAAPKVVQA